MSAADKLDPSAASKAGRKRPRPKPAKDVVAANVNAVAHADATTSPVLTAKRVFGYGPTWWVVEHFRHAGHGRALCVQAVRVDPQFAAVVKWEAGSVPGRVSSDSQETVGLALLDHASKQWTAVVITEGFVEWRSRKTRHPTTQRWLRHRPELHRPIPVAGQKYVLRLGRPTDATCCQQLEKELLMAHRQIPGWERFSEDKLYRCVFNVDNNQEERLRAWREYLGYKKLNWFTFVLETVGKGALAGMVHFRAAVPEEPWIMIYRLSVLPELRNQGLGTVLLRHVMSLGGDCEIRIEVLTAAERLYRRCGFGVTLSRRDVEGGKIIVLTTGPRGTQPQTSPAAAGAPVLQIPSTPPRAGAKRSRSGGS